ncbi:metallo-beta-lactamase domain protein [Amylolactobacillus amylotrophicus DSM 20534]|uniref:Metallo-beta-lactamase domain protein n=3 Tax=Amylolactobacillus TaxID=2767876 RepID=A0A0R1YTH8_9LACO|nr:MULTISPECIES: MBL fold metallo-hydrolase [Amylolactobacillus]APT18458.1 MBL fold metallo-hydrolase [Amylolactobacillus amylophilus DSM 20533 = JCM 1125]KRK38245.1 metallo-beta-lactamase domain protein [Amylolactobacillus amylotrophicus DSM 20534]KRM43113.1 metallo-beta-lactamase domain protein [Amylolactobacillus amylophilus DSM 20533 = JCM 1125]GED80488.1 metallo-hydrolase [Amylolactobacillus amylophilus]
MQAAVLASSSSGNVTYIETKQHKVLVDAGLSGKKITELLASIGRDINDIDSIFITHEHSDHIKGLGVLMRRLNVNVYANSGTWDEMLAHNKIGKVPEDQIKIFEPDTLMSLDDLDINSFTVSHDAREPQFYQFMNDHKRMAILTDTGYASERLESQIKGADAYLLEFNHDLDMLRNGPYGWPLKQRIISDTGHLSNDSGSDALINLVDRHTKKVFLGHLSPHNNTKKLALTAAELTCAKFEPEVNSEFSLFTTDPAVAQPLFVV